MLKSLPFRVWSVLAVSVAAGLGGSASGEIEPARLNDGKVALTPKNTVIQWVGTHVGDDPNPRTGTFKSFKGTAAVDPEKNGLKSVSVEIQTGSIGSEFPNLTNHLKSPDFFDAREFPTANFQSTSVTKNAAGQWEVLGNLTLLGVTKEIRLPVDVVVGDASLQLRGEMTIDRTQFGMDKLTDRVAAEVRLAVTIGQEITSAAQGRSSSSTAGGPSHGDDPEARFKERDADGDGKLVGDELPPRMKQNLDAFDGDGDGAVSLDELNERMSTRRSDNP
jgi:polyisoprenoid-binding protein YceI